MTPCAPVAPVSPVGPIAPVAPVTPVGPIAPVSPMAAISAHLLGTSGGSLAMLPEVFETQLAPASVTTSLSA